MADAVTSNRSLGSLGITACSLVTSVGDTAAASCAAARAGITRATVLDYAQVVAPGSLEAEPVGGHPVERWCRGFTGSGRLVRLATVALRDLYERVSFGPESAARTGMVLALNSGFLRRAALTALEARASAGGESDGTAGDGAGVAAEALADQQRERRSRLPTQVHRLLGRPMPARIEFVEKDQAGIGHALNLAHAMLESGDVDHCIVGGVDSYLDPTDLEALAELQVLKTPGNPVGFHPGEAASFVMLEKKETAGRRGASVIANLERVAIAYDDGHQFSETPVSGVGLAETIGAAMQDLSARGPTPIRMFGSPNGTVWTALEWGNALTRLHGRIGDVDLHLPAAAFGETGAAAGVAALCMACESFVRDYARADFALVWMSASSGDKSATLLRRAKA